MKMMISGRNAGKVTQEGKVTEEGKFPCAVCR